MQKVERPIAREEGKPAYAARPGRSHALQTPRDPAFLRRAVRVSARQDGGAVIVTIANECGHRIPGLVEREIEITAELLDDAGAANVRATKRIDVRSPLAADAETEIVLAGRGTKVRWKAVHRAPGFDKPVVFADEEITLAP
jgi:hypothetical protein